MLEEVRIQGLGVIDDAVLELGRGLTVVTGETGAGKTMVVQGLSLLFGGRGDAGRLRPGATRAVVEGRLTLPAGHPAVLRALDAGAELDDGVLLLSRSVAADGRSRAHVGGRAVPVGVLAELADHTLALHGQSDQQRLLRPGQQRDALDRFGGESLLPLRAAFRLDWARWREVRATLTALQAAAEQRAQDVAALRLGLAEIAAVAPEAGEDLALVAEVNVLANSDDLRAAAETAQRALTGDEQAPDAGDALALLTTARKALEAVAGHDPVLSGLAARATEASHLLMDVAQELASYAASVDADPLRLAAAQDRLAALTALVRRHGVDSIDAVLAWAGEATDRLDTLAGTDDRIAGLHAQDAALAASLGEQAAALSAARVAAAGRFGERVTAELVELAMPQAVVTAAVTQREQTGGLAVAGRLLAATADGVDEVELLLVPHPGAPPRALHKGASGGELSRVMLAVEVVFAGSNPLPVMVFDEVDAGVGGRAAVEVGRRLARLARDHQVVVVTHLPQVAAFADHHLLVVKDAGGAAVTRSGLVALDAEGRVGELSRMMAGLDSGLARGHAEELLAVAAHDRAGAPPYGELHR